MLIFAFWHSMTMLAVESSEVVRLRIARVAAGGDLGFREMQLMIAEKLDAGFEASASLCSGGTPASIVDRYRHHVAINAKRLDDETSSQNSPVFNG